MKRTLVILLAIMLGLGTIGCGSGSSESNDGESDSGKSNSKEEKVAKVIEPEDIISKEYVETIFGTPVVEVKTSEQTATGQKIAFFDLGAAGYFQISLYQTAFLGNPNYDTIRQLYDSNKEFMEVKEDNVEGVGEDAYFSSLGLETVEGDYCLTIMISFSDSDRQMYIDIANHAFENIKKIK